VFPNPAKRNGLWVTADPRAVQQIVVTDIKGITIRRIEKVEAKQLLHLEQGFYLVNIITSNNTVQSRKVIVY
jgi:hypothetical protein